MVYGDVIGCGFCLSAFNMIVEQSKYEPNTGGNSATRIRKGLGPGGYLQQAWMQNLI
jgi:hypothetical protein